MMMMMMMMNNDPLLEEFDKQMRAGLEMILNIGLSDIQWKQATRPIRDGGLGFRRVVMLASSAYVASAASTRSLVSALLYTAEWSDAHLDEILESRSSTKPTGDEQLLTARRLGQTSHSHREGCSVVVQQRPTQPGKAWRGVIATLWGLAPDGSSGLVRDGPEQ